MLDVLVGAVVANPAVDRRRPVARGAKPCRGDAQGVRRGQAANVAKRGGRLVAVESEEQKIGNRGFVELVRDIRVEPQAIERVAEEKQVAEIGVVKRLDAKMISRAEERFSPRVPDGECKIAAQVLHARLAPCGVGVQDQFRIRRRLLNLASFVREFRFEFRATINPRVGGNPELAIEAGRLVLGEGLVRGSKKRVAEADRPVRPDFARVRTAIGK